MLTLFGVLGFERLGIQDFPDTDLPAVVISASLEGAAPSNWKPKSRASSKTS